MTDFQRSLPTDIPWRRICVSRDMLDAKPCDDDRPPRWRSSLVAFRYDPAEEYQPYEDKVISYVKVVATIAPYMPEIVLDGSGPFIPPELIDDIEEAFPCYGALLEISVAPSTVDSGTIPLVQFPYFIDFQPTKREIYEAVTDTGEMLSGSTSQLSLARQVSHTYIDHGGVRPGSGRQLRVQRRRGRRRYGHLCGRLGR